jgi:hypothetical protein
MSVNTHCVVCFTKLYEAKHLPVVQSCRCSGRVCQSCSFTVTTCPWCRKPGAITSSTVDREYLTTVCGAERSAKCSGCGVRKPTRSMATHQDNCTVFLTQTILELETERRMLLAQHDKVVRHNTTLQRDVGFAMDTIDYLNIILAGRTRDQEPDPAHPRLPQQPVTTHHHPPQASRPS